MKSLEDTLAGWLHDMQVADHGPCTPACGVCAEMEQVKQYLRKKQGCCGSCDNCSHCGMDTE